jgi:hypothetical protein
MRRGIDPGGKAGYSPFSRGFAMKTISTRVYRENRARFPVEELRKWDGQWVAFSADGQHILAGAQTITELADRVRALREDLRDVVLERLEMESTEINLGAAELL